MRTGVWSGGWFVAARPCRHVLEPAAGLPVPTGAVLVQRLLQTPRAARVLVALLPRRLLRLELALPAVHEPVYEVPQVRPGAERRVQYREVSEFHTRRLPPPGPTWSVCGRGESRPLWVIRSMPDPVPPDGEVQDEDGQDHRGRQEPVRARRGGGLQGEGDAEVDGGRQDHERHGGALQPPDASQRWGRTDGPADGESARQEAHGEGAGGAF